MRAAESPFVQTLAEPVAHEAVSSRYFLLTLRAPEIARRAQPGQFVMLACQPDASGLDPLLPRPLAVLDADPGAGNIRLLYFVAGRGTGILRAFAASGAGRGALRIIGPLGRGFEALPGAEAHVGVGGGSGVAPLVFFFRRMPAELPGSRCLILAARSADQLARAEAVSAPSTRLHEATDDGSRGFRGHAVAALEALLEGELRGKRAALYVAGPEPMMEAAAKLARARGLPCRVSLEARMACGVGVCRACVVDALTPHAHSGLKRRAICQDGPVFDPCELKAWA
ncbi:MAG: dihydroorotate dehydrogenase electron transfer subunit [Planctomycetota bacterium]|nr:dihydroorotate dehydrogenase electron transfer subunit [Planctomycetota bacterium]